MTLLTILLIIAASLMAWAAGLFARQPLPLPIRDAHDTWATTATSAWVDDGVIALRFVRLPVTWHASGSASLAARIELRNCSATRAVVVPRPMWLQFLLTTSDGSPVQRDILAIVHPILPEARDATIFPPGATTEMSLREQITRTPSGPIQITSLAFRERAPAGRALLAVRVVCHGDYLRNESGQLQPTMDLFRLPGWTGDLTSATVPIPMK